MKNILKQYWGYDDFRGNQEKAIKDLINGKNIVYLEKTGGGKSIVYQIPAIMKEGIAIIISPLKSLMLDQVNNLQKIGVKATFLNSDLTAEENKQRFINLMNGEYKLLYVSPEKISNNKFLDYLKQIPGGINYFIIDEFDTVSEYGETGFRPEFLQLGDIHKQLEQDLDKKIPVGIFTATATQKVLDKVVDMMEIQDNLNYYRGDILGDNIYIEVHKCIDTKEKDIKFFSYIKKINQLTKKKDDSCIVFCSTTKDVDILYKTLKNVYKMDVGKYHGKMTSTQKQSNFNKFMKGKINIIVCTNAFGRGVDKSNIRYVVHYGTPGSISAYMQEIGRGGRDKNRYRAMLFYTGKDINQRKFILRYNDNGEELLEEYQLFLDYLENTKQCRKKLILEYFGLNINKMKNCGNCDYCGKAMKQPKMVSKVKKETTKRKKTTRKKKK